MSKRRPIQHVIDDQACGQLRQALPSEWVVRDQQKDYGIDAEVEVFEDAGSTGIILKTQIKGTQAPDFSADGQCIRLALAVEDLIYLCEQVDIPTFLVLCDVSSGKTYWHAPQLDGGLRARLATASEEGQATLTVHVATHNTLPEGLDSLCAAFGNCRAALAARCLSATTPDTMLSALAGIEDLDAVLASQQRNVSLLHVAKLDRLWQTGDQLSMEKAIADVVGEATSSRQVKFAAHLYREKLLVRHAGAAGRAQDIPKIMLSVAQELRRVVRGGELELRALAALARHAAQLKVLASHDYHLYPNAQVRSASPDGSLAAPVWDRILPAARFQTATRVVRKLAQCSRLLGFMVGQDLFHCIPWSTARVVFAAFEFMLRMRREGLNEGAAHYEELLHGMLKWALTIGVQLHQWDDVSLLLCASTGLADPASEDSVSARRDWALAWAADIDDRAIRQTAESDAITWAEGALAAPAAARPDVGALRGVVEGMATALGVDLDDPDDEIAEVVRIGIEDMDPTRVLKCCRHLFLTGASGGRPAQMLGLPTAGFKTLYCTLHGHGCGALRLDDAYASLKAENCSTCADEAPHPSDWQWTHEWQAKQHEAHGDGFPAL